MATRTVADRLDDVPLNMVRSGGETVPNDVRRARAAHGRVLRRAGRIAGYETDKELAAALGEVTGEPVSKSQLSEWLAGTENAQTWRWQQHPRLGPALLYAELEAEAKARGEELRFTVTLPALKVGA